MSPNSFPRFAAYRTLRISSKMASMKINRFALVLTIINVLAMLAFWSQQQVARAQAVPDMLRARGLEIVDDRGIVRAQIVVQPNDGGVLFRLIDQQRKPLVKLGAGADGSGLMLTGIRRGRTGTDSSPGQARRQHAAIAQSGRQGTRDQAGVNGPPHGSGAAGGGWMESLRASARQLRRHKRSPREWAALPHA